MDFLLNAVVCTAVFVVGFFSSKRLWDYLSGSR
jgi:hypothetical protein